MKNLIANIKDKNYEAASGILSESIALIMEKKFFEMKKQVAAKMCEGIMGTVGPTRAEKLRTGVLEEDEIEEGVDPKENSLSVERGTPQPFKNTTVITKSEPGSTHYKNVQEEEQLDEARIAIVKARVRGGKIQRRKKVSNVEGYKVSGGQLKRMSPSERRNRKLGQRRGKIKRRAKLTRTLMKRQKSLRKRKSLGL